MSAPWAGLDPERRTALLLYAGIGLIVAFALALAAYGYYTDRIAPRHDTVLTVGDRKFDFLFLERRTRAETRGLSFSADDLSRIIIGVRDTIEREEVTRQTAAARGLTLTEAELEAGMRDLLNVSEEASRSRFADRLRTRLLSDGLSLEEFREIATAAALADKFRAEFDAALPAEIEHAAVRLLQVATQAEAFEIKDELAADGNLPGLAATRSIHVSRSSAGELGWVPRGSLPPGLEEVAFSQAFETVSDIVEVDEGFFFLETTGLEVRPFDDDGRAQVNEQSLLDLLLASSDEIGVTRNLTVGQVRQIANSLIRSARSSG